MHAKLLRWGNSYGLRLSKSEVERAGLKPGQEVTVRLDSGDRVDLGHLRTFSDGAGGPDHDRILYGAPSDVARD